jgi:hemolysin III
MWLNRLDHMAIFLLIAGTYTPIVANLFPRHWRMPILAAVWLAALLGMSYKVLSQRIHGFFQVSIYLILGWGGAVPLGLALQLRPVLPLHGLGLLLLGGLIYSGGFLVYYLQRPDPWPRVFGHHEIWHYLFMLLYIVPSARIA